MSYIQRYLADKPLLALVFDPNDTTLYQAREISYLFDIADARILGWVIEHIGVVFIPASGAVGLLAVALIYLRGARKTLKLDVSTSSLLLSLFLSCIVTQASTAIFYRSAKMVLSVALVAFVFYLASLFPQAGRPGRLTIGRLSRLLLLGLVMSLTDRQGLFYLMTATLILGLLAIAAWWRRDDRAGDRVRLTIACIGATAAAAVYSFVVAPRLIDWTGGAAVTYANQRQSLGSLNWTFVSYGFAIFRGQARYLFGNLPFAAVGVMAMGGAAFGLWRAVTRRTRTAGATADLLIAAAVIPAALTLLLAGMVLYHRPIYTVPDHTMWYYTLTVPAVLMLALTLCLAVAGITRAPVVKYGINVALLAMIAGNLLHLGGQRDAMIRSPYIGEQYARTRQILTNERDARDHRIGPGRRAWLRIDPGGATVTLPVEDEAFPEEVRAAYATLRHRAPLDEATGPYWARLYEFLSNSPALLEDPQDLALLIDGLRSVGVRRIEVARRGGTDPPTVESIRAAGPALRETRSGDVVAFDLGAAGSRVPFGSPVRMPAISIHATASTNEAELYRALDGNAATFWSTGAAQAGHEWIRLGFDQPTDVACVGLLFLAENPGRNPPGPQPAAPRPGLFRQAFRPRQLIAETEGEGGSATPFNPLGALIQALLRDPVRPMMEFCLPPNRSRAIILRQTGQSAIDPWNVSELAVWARK